MLDGTVLFNILIVWKTKRSEAKKYQSFEHRALERILEILLHYLDILPGSIYEIPPIDAENEMELGGLSWSLFHTFQTSCHFKWYLRHFLLVYIAVTAYISISVASQSRPIWQKRKICPKPRANLVTEMSDIWPTSPCFWVHSLCQKLECMGKHVREALREREKQARSNVIALHCHLTQTIWPSWVNVSLKKYNKGIQSCCLISWQPHISAIALIHLDLGHFNPYLCSLWNYMSYVK